MSQQNPCLSVPLHTPTKHDSELSLHHGDHVTLSVAVEKDDAVPATPKSATISATPQRYKLRARREVQDPSRTTPSRRIQRDKFSENSIAGNSHTECRSPGGKDPFIMASAAGKWREEQILILCPGSRTTMAQLGCSELTPPTHRIPTRMFRDDNEWRPYYTFKRTKVVDGVEQEEWVEDVDEDKGAVWPLQGGRIVQMDAFLAFLDHVHGMLTTTYHNTPIMLMASPQWTRPDCEAIAQYIFEKTRTPALCMIHSGIATQYGLKWPHMTVVDIGYEKVDVTAIHDGRVVNHLDLGTASADRQISGGEIFTKKLLQKLGKNGFSYDMAEQLKKSTICEVLPYAPGQKNLVELPVETGAGAGPNAGSTTTDSSAQPLKINELPPPKSLDPTADDGETGANGEDDGVLDVAAIVTSGQTKEFLAKKEKEKEKGKGGGRKPKDKEADSGAQKSVRLPNSKRTHNTFAYEEIVQEEVKPNGTVLADQPAKPDQAPESSDKPAQPQPDSHVVDAEASKPAEATGNAPEQEMKIQSKTEPEGETTAAATVAVDAAPTAPTEPTEPAPAATVPEPVPTATIATIDPPERKAKRVRRDIEVGLERFTFADRAEIDRIATTIYRTIQGVDDMYMRPACWDNLVFVGNGARLRGLKENILQTLNARHLISPSTATMFTSELPSNVATPTGTGSQTPTGSFTGAPHQLPSSGVNPLLQAATTASTLGVGGAAAVGTPQPGSDAGGGSGATHHFHSQTPTSIKTPNLPTYLGEWTKNGFEEAMFLGAQVAARIAFCLHSNMDAQSVEAQRLMSLSRVDYNELGPKGVRTHSMLN